MDPQMKWLERAPYSRVRMRLVWTCIKR